MLSGEARIAFLSPERLLLWQQSGFFDELVSRGRDADLYVLDEMHCLDEWRSFRIGYKNLAESLRRELLRGSVLLGLSASLALKEAETWMGELVGEEFFSIVNAGLGRENLNLCVLPLETEKERWLHLLSALRSLRSPETALVYCQSRNEADETARWLRSAGLEAIAYHAGLPAAERAERSRSFRAGRLRVVCATSAFGMGVDYPHVSRVIHFSMPRDLSSYWQEVGRAGRNGKNATAIAFWRRSEIVRARQMPLLEREAFFALWTAWAEGGCRKLAVAKHLGLEEKACGECDRCRDSGSWLYDPGSAWWTEKSANLKHWVNCRREEGI
jgi:ATP-dependent DNA helicase RecQ